MLWGARALFGCGAGKEDAEKPVTGMVGVERGVLDSCPLPPF